ncbi:MAG TPA: AAA family ATPase [Candidatus Kapabacteria bacterium]|nr:AAA family ATPase [Candidatus Kapabacteria bacterium]
MWANVIGQERVKKIVRQALESKMLPNAYLFTGPEGTGKDAVAIELAKALNCLDPAMNGVQACDKCENCRSIGSLASPNLHFLFAIGKEGEDSKKKDDDEPNEILDAIREETGAKARDPYHNISIPKAIRISVGQIRELILLLSRSVIHGKRVVIISEADTMHPGAQNAFLKTLEEPHQNTLIILTSSNPSRLFPTILSRCQDIRFDMLSASEITSALIERDNIDKDQAAFLGRLSGGSLSTARSFVSEDVAALRAEVVQFLLMGLSHNRRSALAEIDTFLPKRGGAFLKNRQNVEQILQLLELWLRDALAIASGAEKDVFNIDQLDYLQRFTKKFGSLPRIVEAIHFVEEAKRKVFLQLQLRPVMLELVMNLEQALIPASN